jgi:hypothetical protein
VDAPTDPALLDRLREASGLRLDAEGRFWHQGSPVEHLRTIEVLHRGLHRAPDGRWATRIGSEWGYVAVDDAARFVRRVEPEGSGVRVWLLTGDELLLPASALAAGALATGAQDALYLRLPDGERARLTRAAHLSLLPLLGEEQGGWTLSVGGARHPIGVDAGPEPVRRGQGAG